VTCSGIGGITAVSTVLPWAWYQFYGITAVLGSKYVRIPWEWGPGLRYYRGYVVGFTWTVNWCMNWGLCTCKFQ